MAHLVDGQGALPIGQSKRVGAPRRASDARVVHEHVEPTDRGVDLREQPLDIGLARDVGLEPVHLRQRGAQALQRRLGDVADRDLGPGLDEGTHDFAADAVGTRRDQLTLAAQRLICPHVLPNGLPAPMTTAASSSKSSFRLGW